jgi:Zn-dependent protease
MSETIFTIATWLVPLVIAIVFHEVAHGLVARRLGDPTAERLGRLTLNPLKHTDPIGTIALPMVLALAKAPIFGWAKPVPVDYRQLRNPRRDMVLVALAGPGMNFLLATLATIILAVVVATTGGEPTGAGLFVAQNAINFLLINLFLGIFNLIPLPPFDGGHVVEGFLPRSTVPAWQKLGRFALPILILLLLVLPLISPELNFVGRVISPIVTTVAQFFLGVAGISA